MITRCLSNDLKLESLQDLKKLMTCTKEKTQEAIY